jgi:hypothetical protein
MTKYKLYSKLFQPIYPSKSIIGHDVYEFNNSDELVKAFLASFNKINFLYMIEDYIFNAEDFIDNFNSNQFKIDCSDSNISDTSEGLYTLYDLSADPQMEKPIIISLLLDVLNFDEFFYIYIRPSLDHSIPYELEKNLSFYFYSHPTIKKVLKDEDDF